MTAALLALVLAPLTAAAESTSVCARLRRLAEGTQGIEDQEHLTTFRYRAEGRLVKTFRTRVYARGLHEALVAFEAPGDLRGTRILIADVGNMYVYLPEFRRVRRIAGHALRRPFMGTNIYYEDIIERRFTTRWDCRPLKSTADAYTVELRPKSGVSTAYSKLRVTLSRAKSQPRRVEYYEGGRHVRSQVRGGWQTVDGVELATRMHYISHDRDAELIMELSELRLNQGLPDRIFTRRTLMTGR